MFRYGYISYIKDYPKSKIVSVTAHDSGDRAKALKKMVQEIDISKPATSER
jgi:hypothetical protein